MYTLHTCVNVDPEGLNLCTAHPIMEIQLLKGRFKDNPLVESCGDFKNGGLMLLFESIVSIDFFSVFFCARRVNSHSYEGRLYLTESALFFVSSL